MHTDYIRTLGMTRFFGRSSERATFVQCPKGSVCNEGSPFVLANYASSFTVLVQRCATYLGMATLGYPHLLRHYYLFPHIE